MTNLPIRKPWLSLINFSRYWADTVFALNASVTLTFDLWTSKFIGVIYWPWPIFLLSRMTVSYKLFNILSGHGFCIKCYCDLDLWPSDLKMYRGHLQTMTNLPTMIWLTDGRTDRRTSLPMGICWVFLLFKTTQQANNYPKEPNGMNGKFSQMDIC